MRRPKKKSGAAENRKRMRVETAVEAINGQVQVGSGHYKPRVGSMSSSSRIFDPFFTFSMSLIVPSCHKSQRRDLFSSNASPDSREMFVSCCMLLGLLVSLVLSALSSMMGQACGIDECFQSGLEVCRDGLEGWLAG